ncbi:AAA family ATPase [Microbacterium sp. Leaf151]|uniref:AAA family ATPase n=1 Tax=Microbacterium sp. Leaf151 TaxID=1736276 RepID=UPI000B031A36|nr:AAA family ATPase [Microbacterium sp. Leaf151]
MAETEPGGTMLDDDDRRLMHAVNAYLQDMHRVVQSDTAGDRTPLGDELSAHLGVDAATLPVTSESVSAHRYVDADIALDELMSRSGGRLIGVTGGEQRLHVSASDLIAGAYSQFAPGPVSYESRDVSADAQRRVVSFGVRLLTFAGQPLAIVQRAANPRSAPPQPQLELIGSDADATAAALVEIRRLMIERSVLRGQVLSFAPTEYGHGAGATFLARPDVAADDIVLGEGVLSRIVDHVVGIGDHREALRAAGQHLKRGVLLYGPPGTGKTLSVRHLLSLTPDTTAVVLTGSSIRFITAAAEIARTFAPALVVLEDIDLVAADRGHSPQPVLFDVLDALDGLEPDADIAFVMTTNHVQILEEALAARPGRVDLGVEIPLPDEADRRRLFRRYAHGLTLSEQALDAAADRAAGTTGSFAKELLRGTVLRAALRGDAEADDADLAATLDELLDSGAALTRVLLGSRQELTLSATPGADGAPPFTATAFSPGGPDDPVLVPTEGGVPWEDLADSPVDTTPPTHELVIPMPVWHTVYATLGNTGSVERVGGDPLVAARAVRIQHAGGVAAERHPGPRATGGWPRDDDHLAVPLAEGDEEFLLEIVAKSRQVSRRLLADGDLDAQTRREQEECLEADAQALRFLAEQLLR